MEELKKKTRCHRCWAIGARNAARVASPKEKAKAKTKTRTKNLVQHSSKRTNTLWQLSAKSTAHHWTSSGLPDRDSVLQLPRRCTETLLVSSPGFGVLDSGCGRTIIGIDTLNVFKQQWKQLGIACPPHDAETNHFRFGNGHKETSTEMIPMLVWIAGKRGCFSEFCFFALGFGFGILPENKNTAPLGRHRACSFGILMYSGFLETSKNKLKQLHPYSICIFCLILS